mmetsp:Transcript_138194/g.385516  ORF Transcript_138194/g.385516 Transcript_138194/m.385516 type:complete len:288 (-) Transcript_138194:696-1559(-)
MAFLSSATSCASVAALSAKAAMVALPSSVAAVSLSTSALSSVRVTRLLPISLSQKPSCSASAWASSWRRVIMPSIIALTFAKGSVATCFASRPRRWLWIRAPSAARNSRRRPRMPSARAPAPWPPPASCTRAAVAGRRCARLRCCSAAVRTSGAESISMAFSIASISSVRNFCFSSKDSCFSLHSAFVVANIFSFSALTLMVAASCFLAAATASAFRSFSTVFSPSPFFAFSTVSVRSMVSISWACLEFISSFWLSPNFALKSSLSLWSSSTMLPDWNSYALASGAS